MKEIGIKVLIVLVVVVSIIVFNLFKYGVKGYMEHNAEIAEQEAWQKGKEEALSKIEASIEADTSDRLLTDKAGDASRRFISDSIGNVPAGSASEKDKILSAGAFAGQYGRYTVSLDSYCGPLGADVSGFTNKYKDVHKQLYNKSDAIFRRNDTSMEKAYSLHFRELGYKYVKQEVADMRTAIIQETGDKTVELVDVCDYYNYMASDPELMSMFAFNTGFPKAYNILME